MRYIDSFKFLGVENEEQFVNYIRRTCYTSFYPFGGAQRMSCGSCLFGCQFILATHSPFLLALKGALIYDLDERPVDIKKWTELEGVRTYFEFFEKHKNEF